MPELNIVDLIETNPITRLSNAYQNKLLCKIKDKFSNNEQQLFVASFYCFLNYNQSTEFIIDLDKIWQWLGFTQKVNAKRLLEKSFLINIDYKRLLFFKEEQKPNGYVGRGGHNKDVIMLTIKTFKSLCLKAGTKKADQIHDYYLNLEETLHEVIQEESNELKLQFEKQNTELQKTEKDRNVIREKTLLEQFYKNTQCVYYGTIDNPSNNNEKLIKFGNSNNLRTRVCKHKDTYDNFSLVNAFKVDNKLQIENAIKNNPLFTERLRTITIKNKNYIELLTIDGLDFTELDKTIKDIITSIEYSPTNYIKILEENKLLRNQLEKNNETKDVNKIVLLTAENKRLLVENSTLLKKYNTLKRKTKTGDDINTEELLNEPSPPLETNNHENIIQLFKRPTKNKNGKYDIHCKTYDTLFGSRDDVWTGKSYKTVGGLTQNDLLLNERGKIVSKRKYIQETTHSRFIQFGVNKPRQSTIAND